MQISKPIVSYSIKKEHLGLPTASLEPITREEQLTSQTYKIKFNDFNYYITISNQDINGVSKPFELFINTKDTSNYEWLTMTSLLISAVLRTGGSIDFVIKELQGITAPKGGSWCKILGSKSKYYSSVLNIIGEVLEQHINRKAL